MTRHATIVALIMAGRTTDEITAQLAISRNYVSAVAYTARKRGELPSRSAHSSDPPASGVRDRTLFRRLAELSAERDAIDEQIEATQRALDSELAGTETL